MQKGFIVILIWLIKIAEVVFIYLSFRQMIEYIFLTASPTAYKSLSMKYESVNRRYYGTAVYCL